MPFCALFYMRAITLTGPTYMQGKNHLILFCLDNSIFLGTCMSKEMSNIYFYLISSQTMARLADLGRMFNHLWWGHAPAQ